VVAYAADSAIESAGRRSVVPGKPSTGVAVRRALLLLSKEDDDLFSIVA